MSRPSFRARRLIEAEAAYLAVLDAGFLTADFDGQPEPERLQGATDRDVTNWLAVTSACQIAISQGAGDDDFPVPIRCKSNRMYTVSNSDALTRMLALFAQASQAQANLWRLKDLVSAAASGEELNAIDTTQGWP